jgi:predicted RNA-binding Zn ribbon-like protein
MTDHHEGSAEPRASNELFVEFANGARLASPEAPQPERELPMLAAWLAEQKLVTAEPSRSRLEHELPAFRDLADLVRGVAARLDGGRRPTRAQVAGINRVLRDGLHYHVLRSDPGDGNRFSMAPVGDELDQARAAVAGSLAHYLAEHDPDRLRVCDGCRWIFVDRSPAGRRRWCDMSTCGNRAKVARHRARARASSDART